VSTSALPRARDARRPGAARGTARRWLRRLLLLTALLAAAGTWAWLERSAATPARVAALVDAGLPAAPSLWTRLRVAAAGPPRVALQVGHLDARAHPDELARLRTSTGARSGGLREVDVNLAVAEALANRLARAGVRVELLPATVPPGYRADVLLAVHADANVDPARRGYKSAHREPPRNRREPWLRRAVDAAYLAAAPLPHDAANVTGAMLDYYAFAHRRLRHAAHPATAGLIVELGYLSHPQDRAWLDRAEAPARALAEGVLGYLAAIDRWHPELAAGSPEDRAGRPHVVASGP
jgi:N-acetylmuramoyl-L-alanine amidase